MHAAPPRRLRMRCMAAFVAYPEVRPYVRSIRHAGITPMAWASSAPPTHPRLAKSVPQLLLWRFAQPSGRLDLQ
eukprot:COSAG02_NODE_3539_length_6589_cov_3.693066_6_plen_74_part_00